MSGIEFMVVEDPSENGTKTEYSGPWVIRKQIRKTDRSGVLSPEITPISCYIIIGDVIHMAPTMGDVLSSRLVGGL